MLKRWRINLKNKKKEKLANNNRIQKYSIKGFAWNTFALIYASTTIFLAGFHEDKNGIPPKITQKINQIQKDMKKVTLEKTAKAKEKQIAKIEKTIQALEQTCFNNPKINKLETKSKIQVKVAKQITILKENVQRIKPTNIIAKEVKKEFVEPLKSNNMNGINQDISQSVPINTSQPLLQGKFKKETNAGQKMLEQPVKITISILNVIEPKILDYKKYNEEQLEKIGKVQKKIYEVVYYNQLYDLTREMEEIEKSVTKVYLEYSCFDNYKNSSFFKISFDSVFEKTKNAKKQIENKKKELYYQKKEVEITKENQIKKGMTEIDKIRQLMMQNIAMQESQLRKLTKELAKSPNKKKTLFTRLKSFFLYTLQLLFSPFSINDKELERITRNMMINNHIKTMRKMVNPNYNAFYSVLEKELENNLEKMTYLYNTCQNSLQELEMLEHDIRNQYPLDNQVNDVLQQNQHLYDELQKLAMEIEQQGIIPIKHLVKEM